MQKQAEDSSVIVNNLVKEYQNMPMDEVKKDLDNMVNLGIVFDTEKEDILKQLENQPEPEVQAPQTNALQVLYQAPQETETVPEREPLPEEPGAETEVPEAEPAPATDNEAEPKAEKPEPKTQEHKVAPRTFSDVMKPKASLRIAKIVKRTDGYHVISESKGKNLGGPYKTKEEAEKRLRQVEYFKNQ